MTPSVSTFFVIPVRFTTMMANNGLEKARAYLNQVPQDSSLMSPLKGMKAAPLLNFWVKSECIL